MIIFTATFNPYRGASIFALCFMLKQKAKIDVILQADN